MAPLSYTIAYIVLMAGIVSGQENNGRNATSEPISFTAHRIQTPATAPPTTSNPYSECGRVSDEGFRIIGGQDAKDGQYPWVARLKVESPASSWVCTGTIIDERHILTVADCVIPTAIGVRAPRIPHPRYFTVYTGSTSRLGGKARKVQLVIKHQNYNPLHTDFDVAILRLAEPISFNSLEGRVCLNKDFQEEAGKACRVIGWGSTINGSSSTVLYPDTLQAAIDSMLGKEECQALVNHSAYDDYLCGAGGDRNFCWGDSGAPYVCQEESRWYLFGLAASHFSPITCTQPGQYMKVSFFYDWIQGILSFKPNNRNNTDNPETDCGTVRDDNFKIIGGADAKDGQYPWMARIVFQNDLLNYSCAGAIVDESFVLTVAHCVQPNPIGDVYYPVQDPSYFTVYTGSASLFGGKARQVERLVKHRNYDAYYLDFDIAILKLTEPIEFNYNEGRVCLNEIFQEEVGKQCRVLGWGLTSNEAGAIVPPRDVLQSAVDPMISRTQCKAAFGRYYFKDFLCGAGGNQNFCEGDSGAPYVCEQDGRWYLYGLAAAHLDTETCTTPGKYTKVSYFSQWVKNMMRLLG